MRNLLVVALLVLAWSVPGCAHAPPAIGNKNLQAPIDPDNPEVNCLVNSTLDCRPNTPF